MKKLKVMTVVGTRPEVIRLSRVICELDRHCEHVLVHTGQNYDFELNQVFFDDLQIRRPDIFLEAAGETAAETIGNVIIALDRVLDAQMPEALLVLGDTNSCLAVIPAKRRKIPIFHMEAGNRCFDQRVPEEINRRIVDHTADINLTYSSIAREYLLNEGLPADQVIKTGSPMYEILAHNAANIDRSEVLGELNIEANSYFVVSIHREENVVPEASFRKIIKILNSLYKKYNLPVILSAHPRTAYRISTSDLLLDPGVKICKPFGFFDYVYLQKSALAVLSDSGTINEESSILGFKALNIREAHERPEGMEEAAVMMSGLDWERISQCLEVLLNASPDRPENRRIVSDYSMPDVSSKIVKIIHSYTDYVNRVVWKKY